MNLDTYTPQPRDIKDYDVDYSPWLAPGDSITAVAVTITSKTEGAMDSPDALRVARALPGEAEDPFKPAIQWTDTLAKIWVQGGEHGVTYKATLLIDTALGRRDEAELTFKVKDT
ncbi:hypothetical protein CCO03_16955 [Comamonas serinivorans]|uniref:Uncharacterized protein n=1 Tax=Comamonas serinivorans TaxID=1082851 RepID=A0A1Y0ER55_9BURK|nr:hypothetical protein [Comamonas serinivorans]ARU06135.1 hypothetical protein CCO03_16955 [Comamonas serinivorans]